MSQLVEVRAIVRRQVLDRVVQSLNHSGVPRVTVTRGHAVGAAVAADPGHFGEEGVAYRDVALVQCICSRDRCTMVAELICRAAHTGHAGDGIVSVHPVLPGFRWLTMGGFVIGLVESLLYGIYAGLVFTPIYNTFFKRWGQHA